MPGKAGQNNIRLLVLTSRFPYPLEKGDKLRAFHQIRVLSQHFEVHLISLSDHHVHKEIEEKLRPYCQTIRVLKLNRMVRWLGMIRLVWKKWPYQVLYFYNPGINRRIKQLFAEIQPHFTLCQLIRMAPYTLALDGPKALDFMDCFSLNARTGRGVASFLNRNKIKRLERYELGLTRQFQHYFAISERDRSFLPTPANGDIQILKNGVDLDQFAFSEHLDPVFDFGFCGNLGYEPNRLAAYFLIDEIIPRFQNHKILIAGARVGHQLLKQAGDRLKVHGWVDDIREVYRSMRIFVAPIFTGSGMQNKILEAMALGIPCITTPFVNDSIDAVDGRDLLIAERPEEFEVQIQRLLSKPKIRERIRENARLFVAKRHRWDTSTQILVDTVNLYAD